MKLPAKHLKNKLFGCLIVGAGPAGLFAAFELIKNGVKNIAIVDKGKSSQERKPEDVMYGVGGAGLFSDGKLNLTAKRFKTDLTEFLPLSEANKIIQEIEETLAYFGVKEPSYPANTKKAEEFRKSAKKLGLDLLVFREKHLGSDKLPIYIKRFEDYLKKNGVVFFLEKEAEKILTKDGEIRGIKLADNKEIYTNFLIAARGVLEKIKPSGGKEAGKILRGRKKMS